MQTNHLYDAPSIAAQYTVRNHLTAAAREQLLHDARPAERRSARFIEEIGHTLVYLGQRLQTVAQRPTVMEETV
ncbi:MAG: hypothetical protein ACYDAR_02810 [Thermomicrobiales bacterium]